MILKYIAISPIGCHNMYFHTMPQTLMSLICTGATAKVFHLNPRIVEYPKLERTHTDYLVQLLSPHRPPKNQTVCESIVQTLLEHCQVCCHDLGASWGACSSAPKSYVNII